MRVVIDTNIFLSAALKDSSLPADVVRWVDRHARLLISDACETELWDVMARPKIINKVDENFRVFLESCLIKAERIKITAHYTGCRDPKDDKFLDLAVWVVPYVNLVDQPS
ncbi:MAG: putative toxin-antitoxin system toxin component, PIN family [Magnetococcus sp. YQC-9]